MKKLFFFDMDGTMLPHGHGMKISDKTVYALNELTKLGHDVILNTGKTLDMCLKQFEQYHFKYAITSNGQVLTVNDIEITAGKFEDYQIDYWIDFAKNNNVAVGFQTSTSEYVLKTNNAKEYTQLCFGNLNVELPAICDKVDYTLDTQQLWLFGELDNLVLDPSYDYFKWHQHALDVQLKGVSKAAGIKSFLKHMNYEEYEIYTFGDGENDLSMFELADVAVAVGNASDLVKSKADVVTSSVHDEGIYNYLVKNKIIPRLDLI